MAKMTNQQKADTRKECLKRGIQTRHMGGLELYNKAVEFGIINRGNNKPAAAAPKADQFDKPFTEGAVFLVDEEKLKPKQKSTSKLEDALRELMPEGELDEARVIELIHQYSTAPKVTNIKVEQEGKEPVVIEGAHCQMPDLLVNVAAGVNTFLVGPAGSGKTTACEMVAEALGREFYFSGAVTQEHKLMGFVDANGTYHETQFYKAFTEGAVFLLDEVDGSNPNAIMAALNAAAANGLADFPCGKVKAHEDFVLIAAGNTYGTGASREYVGRTQLDGATLDRFAFMDWGYDEVLERKVALAQWDGADSWVDTVQALRRNIEKAGLRHIVSPRASIMGAKLLKAGMEHGKIVKMVLHKGLSQDQIAQIA